MLDQNPYSTMSFHPHDVGQPVRLQKVGGFSYVSTWGKSSDEYAKVTIKQTAQQEFIKNWIEFIKALLLKVCRTPGPTAC